jgi:hypothetical protein
MIPEQHSASNEGFRVRLRPHEPYIKAPFYLIKHVRVGLLPKKILD